MQTRMCSPYGEHFVCCTYNAPTDEAEAKLYVTLTRVRYMDSDMRAMMRVRDMTRDPEYEPPTD